jgi:ABC-type polysaccharide/polyol phosphate export permease
MVKQYIFLTEDWMKEFYFSHGISIIVFVTGVINFRRMEKEIADVI